MNAELKKKPLAKKPTAKTAPKSAPRLAKKASEQKAIVFEAASSRERESREQPTGKGQYYYAIGRRKEAVATVRLYKNGKGAVTINGKELNRYFPWPVWQNAVLSPLQTVGQADKLDVTVKVIGGGLQGQADAVRHGISRALLQFNPVFRRGLKKVGFLTRDPRVKERKKYGLKRARRGPQWAKR